MPEGPTIVVFREDLARFEGETVTESGGYKNPFSEELGGEKLLSITSYGKYLILQFGKFFITVHFGLFGSFLINDRKKVNASFSLHFGGDKVNFYVVNIKKIEGKSKDFFDEELDVFSKSFDAKKTAERLTQKLSSKKIGDALMNQEIFPGLGNVIRNEILFLSKIHPDSIVGKIPPKKIAELIENFRTFSIGSPELIRKKIWKSSSAVYQKEKFQGKPVEMYVSAAIKRKTFFVEGLQKKYD